MFSVGEIERMSKIDFSGLSCQKTSITLSIARNNHLYVYCIFGVLSVLGGEKE